MLRALLVLCLVSVAAPAAAQEYQSKELADAARDWRQELIDSVPANKKQPALDRRLAAYGRRRIPGQALRGGDRRIDPRDRQWRR